MDDIGRRNKAASGATSGLLDDVGGALKAAVDEFLMSRLSVRAKLLRVTEISSGLR
jgi:hypothetical protein